MTEIEKLRSNINQLRKALIALADASAAAGNIIPWSIYSNARTAIADTIPAAPLHPEYLRGIDDAAKTADATDSWDRIVDNILALKG